MSTAFKVIVMDALRILLIAALVAGPASIAGGIVLYRGSGRVGWRAVGVAAAGGGAGLLVLTAIVVPVWPVSSTGTSTTRAPRRPTAGLRTPLEIAGWLSVRTLSPGRVSIRPFRSPGDTTSL